MVGDAQVSPVLFAVVRAVTQQHRFLGLYEVIPRDGDQIGPSLDIDRTVVRRVKDVMVHPDVMGVALDIDGVVRRIHEREVVDNDVRHLGEGTDVLRPARVRAKLRVFHAGPAVDV